MKSREELRNDYEEALFAMIMDEIMDLEGEALIAERERLALTDEYKLSDDLNEKCIAVIHDAFEAKNKETRTLKTRKLMRTLLIAAIVMSVLFTTVYASVPAVKRATDGLIVRVLSVSTKMLFGDENDIQLTSNYTFWFIPEGFLVEDEGTENNSDWYRYSNGDSWIKIKINYEIGNREFDIDTEDANEIRNIKVCQFEGILVCEEERVHFAVLDIAHNNSIQITAKNVDPDMIIEILKNAHYNE